MKKNSKPTTTIPHQNRLTKEVSIVLILKLIFIFLLWTLFFSHPLAKHINDSKFAEHLLNNSQPLINEKGALQ